MIKEKILKKLQTPIALYKKIVHVPYYYVPPCPNCGSRKTGYYIRSNGDYQTRWSEIQAFKNGELVEAVPIIPRENAFCIDCGYNWKELIDAKMMSLEFISNEIEARKTNILLKGKIEERDAIRKEKEAKRGIVSNKVAKFVGRL